MKKRLVLVRKRKKRQFFNRKKPFKKRLAKKGGFWGLKLIKKRVVKLLEKTIKIWYNISMKKRCFYG